ncbi:o-succinylbenzoate synthase [Halococcus hamelinensis]|uniref:o-succinylbenzoate synthase n=2 Tax=Halococcus hamelinensis TaxID=332168 RepID=M0LZW5_9EURY|nr:o-succinylbenzoate synthase [Halococcus hamelinensis]EMA37670.1 chloromuconate cycloisomerase [Halococcus hamelinensis 100A6]
MRVEPFSLRLSTPLSTAHGTIDARDGFVVRVEVDGTRGVGEASPLPGWTESLDDCADALERAQRTGCDGWDAALADLDDAPAARHGLALALADARSRAADVPFYRYLGGDSTDRVPVNATIGDGSVEETVAEARQAVEAGFTTLKVKVGTRAVDADLERLRAVRAAVGADIALRADANAAWDASEARRALPELADLDLAYLEQPLSSTDLAGHSDLRGDVPIALDESLAEHSVAAVVEAGAADRVVLKPMVLGGPDRAREAALAAREAGLDAVLSTTIDGALARAGAVHVAASLPDPPAAGLATADRLATDLIPDPAPVDDGHADVPQGAGNAPDPAEG